jgi:hypothetical protein
MNCSSLSRSASRARKPGDTVTGFMCRASSIPTFRDHTIMLSLPDNAYSTPMRYTADPLISGYISKPQLERICSSAAVVVSASGSGRVIAATDNPVFRAFWFGTDKLLANAIFFGHTISAQTAAR